jgi:phosphatidylinositol-bisphosphatase
VPAEVIAVREALDTGAEFGAVSVHSVAEVLLALLQALPSPVIPEKLMPSMELDQQNLRPWTRRFLEQLPPLSYNVFVYLVSFFREVRAPVCLFFSNTHPCCSLCHHAFPVRARLPM